MKEKGRCICNNNNISLLFGARRKRNEAESRGSKKVVDPAHFATREQLRKCITILFPRGNEQQISHLEESSAHPPSTFFTNYFSYKRSLAPPPSFTLLRTICLPAPQWLLIGLSVHSEEELRRMCMSPLVFTYYSSSSFNANIIHSAEALGLVLIKRTRMEKQSHC